VRLAILTIGKMKKGPESDLLARYVKRSAAAGRQIGLSGPDILEWPESRAATVSGRKDDEARNLLSGLGKGSVLISLDEAGREFTSTQFAKLIQSNLDKGVAEMAFVIGGPDGLGTDVIEAGSLKLCLGRMTWPHQLARVLLAEQVYRAITILTGHPYHRN